MKEPFECLRCGECCEVYALTMPDGQRKEPFTICTHLRQSVFEKGILTFAACGLHGKPEQPDICGRTFRTNSVLSDFEGPCRIGSSVWSRHAARYGIERLPERVREVLYGIRKKREP